MCSINAVGVLLTVKCESLVGHIPIEISSLMTNFLNSAPKNTLKVKVIGKRKREVGLVIPVNYHAEATSERISNILYKKLVEKKNTQKHFELNVDRDGIKEGKAVKTVVRVKYQPK